jgi:hypothetical protein
MIDCFSLGHPLAALRSHYGLPQAAHQRVLRAMGKEFWARTDNLNLLTAGSLRRLFPSCSELTVHSLRLFGWPSNVIAYGNK